MGGCCCCFSSKRVELNRSSPFYHYPVASEEHEPLSSHQGPTSNFSTGFLVDTNLETSIPDTYRPPPTPLPFDLNLGHPRSPLNNRGGSDNTRESSGQITNSEVVGERDISICDDIKEVKESNCKVLTDNEAVEDLEGEVDDDDLKKPSEPIAVAIEECPTCLEEYDEDNPKIITKCEHHFHLSCIFEWMERSDTCPVCGQEMVFNSSIEG